MQSYPEWEGPVHWLSRSRVVAVFFLFRFYLEVKVWLNEYDLWCLVSHFDSQIQQKPSTLRNWEKHCKNRRTWHPYKWFLVHLCRNYYCNIISLTLRAWKRILIRKSVWKTWWGFWPHVAPGPLWSHLSTTRHHLRWWPALSEEARYTYKRDEWYCMPSRHVFPHNFTNFLS